MKKQELLESIDEAVRTEESAVSVYLDHLSALVSRAGLSGEDTLNVKVWIENLAAASQKHKNMLLSIRQRVESSVTDEI